MKEIKTGLRIDMHGNIVAQSQRYTDAINKFATKGRRDMKLLGDSTNRVRGNFDQMGNRMAALATGAGAIAIVAQVGQMERRMTRLGIASNQTTETINGLKNEIYAAATSPDIRVDPSKIITAIESILEMTGDFEFSKDQIRNIGLALQATGADAEAVGGMFAEFQKAGIKSPKAVAQAIDTLNVQGKEGAFTLAEFARMGPRLYSAYAAVGRVGQMASREIGAVAQVVRGATGSSEQATTSIEALLRVFTDAKKIDGLRKAGIQVFDVAELKKGREVLRPINELMADIVRKTKGRATVIQDLLGDAESTRAFGNLIKEYNQTGDVKSLQHFMQMMGDGATTLKDAQRAANDSAAALDELGAVLSKLADDTLTGPIHFVADQLKSLMNDYREFKSFGGQIVDEVMAPRSNRGASIKAKPGPLVSEVSGEPSVAPAESIPAKTKQEPLVSQVPGESSAAPIESVPAKPKRVLGRGGYMPLDRTSVGNLGATRPAETAPKAADGKVTLEIVSPTPVTVKSVQANSGEINVKNTRAGAHFQ